MSNVVTDKCRPIRIPPTPKSVLMALADYANDAGECWPSIPTVCEWTCFSERAVHGAIKWLEQAGLVRADRSDGRHTHYLLTPERFQGANGAETHYVYRTVHVPSGAFYIGSRSCFGRPEDDSYIGSGAALVGLPSSECAKEVVSTYPTREQANAAETSAIAMTISDPKSLNRKVSNPSNAGGNPRRRCAPQEMRPAAGAVEPPQQVQSPPQQVQSPPQELRSNHQEPLRTTKKATAKSATAQVDMPDGVDPQTWADWLALRKKKNAPVTPTVLRGAIAEAGKAGLPLNRFLEIWCLRGSQGLQADWLKPAELQHARAGPNGRQPMGKQAQGLMALEAMKSGNRMAAGRDTGGASEALLLGVGSDASGRDPPGYG